MAGNELQLDITRLLAFAVAIGWSIVFVIANTFIFYSPKVHAESTIYNITDASMTPGADSGNCNPNLVTSTPSDGAQGSVMSTQCSGKNKSVTIKWTKTLTWETMGVPAGASVTTVDGSFKYRQAQESHAVTQAAGALQLRDSADSATCAAANLEASFDPTPTSSNYTTRDSSGAVNVNSGCETSTTSVTIRLDVSPNTGNNNSAVSEVRLDDVSITIVYFMPVFAQSAYRFFANSDSTDVGSTLALQDTPITLSSAGEQFRLRMLSHVSTSQLFLNGKNFKLQYVDKGAGSCASPSGGTPSTYTDVTTSTSISYNDNAAPADSDALTTNVNDPNHSGHTTRAQTYEEANNFTNSQAVIAAGEDGLWDFALYDNGADSAAEFCFRVVESDGTVLSSYVYPQVTTASGTLSVDIVDSGGAPVGSPSVSFSGVSASSQCQTSTGTLGESSQKVRVNNDTGNPAWSLSIAATSGVTSNWSNGVDSYDFNDPTSSGCDDGGDADGLPGQLSVDSSVATNTPEGGCSTTGINLGSASAYNQGTVDSITIASASGSAETGCFWDFTGIGLSQKIPSFQAAGSYSLQFTITVVAN